MKKTWSKKSRDNVPLMYLKNFVGCCQWRHQSERSAPPAGGRPQDTDQSEAHDDQSEAHDDQSEAHDDQSEAHDDQSEAHDDQSEAYDDQSEAHDDQSHHRYTEKD
jgi:hypothetical protein